MSNQNPNELPSQAYLLECFDYNPETGILVRKERPLSHFKNKRGFGIYKTRFAGKIAGVDSSGYLKAGLDKQEYLVHRIAYKMITGIEPSNSQIDHENGIKNDNRFCNLRIATHGQNQHNRDLQSNNTSGHKGVHFDKQRQKWMAFIRFNTTSYQIGRYATIEEAIIAVDTKRKELHTACSNTGFNFKNVEQAEEIHHGEFARKTNPTAENSK